MAAAKRTSQVPWLRVVREPSLYKLPATIIRGPDDIYRLLKDRFEREEVEVFIVLSLDSRARVRSATEVSRGLLNVSLVDPRETFRLAIAHGAAAVILCHNHPSGDPTPSAEDRAITQKLVAAGTILDIPVYDHVVFGDGRFASFAMQGLI